MKIQIIKKDERYITIGKANTYNWALTNISGISDLKKEIGTEDNAFSDGSQVTHQRYPSREIDIDFCYTAPDPNRIIKRNIISFLNSKEDFVIKITEGDEIRWISGQILAFKADNPSGSSRLKVSTTFLCTDPFFYSNDNFGKNIASIEKRFGFPWFNPIDEYSPIGTYNFERSVELVNYGDLASAPALRIMATGTVINPKIMINDVYIRLIDTLQSGDVIYIDLTRKTVRKNGLNCIGLVDRTSSFSDMMLSPGNNLVKYEADSGDVNMNVVLYYYNKYLGA